MHHQTTEGQGAARNPTFEDPSGLIFRRSPQAPDCKVACHTRTRTHTHTHPPVWALQTMSVMKDLAEDLGRASA